ncbi:hypothetical protein [Hymenobacter guriensis]|uniref:Phage ABA sandwich domain-containing protein n=1 Tax=Hymenobacter guriensis TaxID=2793065 RepID=A0ABS0KWU9_9BACT|nr:hypothetical protein [Hymenobacter guriensis]MBG8552339.1 hypothetical protein [Hymenobacter guriensis]
MENLTKEQIEQMPAGQDLNRLITELMEPKPTSWQLSELRKGRDWGYNYATITSPGEWWECNIGIDAGSNNELVEWYDHRDPSAEIVDAWPVVEKMNATHYVTLSTLWLTGGSDKGTLGFRASFRAFKTFDGPEAIADTAPLALCRAFLLSTLPK